MRSWRVVMGGRPALNSDLGADNFGDSSLRRFFCGVFVDGMDEAGFLSLSAPGAGVGRLALSLHIVRH